MGCGWSVCFDCLAYVLCGDCLGERKGSRIILVEAGKHLESEVGNR